MPVENHAPVAARRPDSPGFSLVEVLLVVALLSLIVLVLMSVFNSTQSAFRTGVTQTDVLQNGQVAMDMITSDLKLMSSSGYYSNTPTRFGDFASASVNFYATSNLYYTPLIQNLVGSPDNRQRSNILENFFFLSRQNSNGHNSWVGVGYTVGSSIVSAGYNALFPLYRFETNAPVASDPYSLLNAFINGINSNVYTNTTSTNGWSHLINGVVDMRVRAFDPNGFQMTNSLHYNDAGQLVQYPNVWFGLAQSLPNDYGFAFFSNTIPASVEVQLGILEDRTLQRAVSMPAQSTAQINYLADQAGHVRIFRQRVAIPNVDPTVYP